MFAVFLTKFVVGMGAYFFCFDEAIEAKGAEVLGDGGRSEGDQFS